MNRRVRAILASLAVLCIGHAGAAEMNMRVFPLNDHLLSFYDGRPPEPSHKPAVGNWADTGALNVGVATYVIHRGDAALVYDTYPTVREAQWVRDYLTKAGIRHFTVVNSHWHLDHVGGNAVYSDADRIATQKTIQLMAAKKTAIEAGTEWGPPAIKPLVVPNIGISADTRYYVGDIEVQLRPVNIHSEDGLVLYLPADRTLLAGDTLEDTVTFISEPEHIVEHWRNLQKLKQWDIARIFPNHGNPEVISHGGYGTTLIDATIDYLHKVMVRAHHPDQLNGSLEDYVGDSVQKGWVSVWWAYHDAHADNLRKMAKALQEHPIPGLPE